MSVLRPLRVLRPLVSRRFWFSRGMAIAVMTLAFIVLSGQKPFRTLDDAIYSVATSIAPEQRLSDEVVVLKMDPQSRREWGTQLPRPVLADVIASLNRNRVAVIGVMADLQGHEDSLAKSRLSRVEELNVEEVLSRRDGRLARRFESRLEALKESLSSDGRLAQQLESSRRAVVTYTGVPSYGESPDTIDKSERLPDIIIANPVREEVPQWLLGNQLPQLEQVALPDKPYRDVVSVGMYEASVAQQNLVYQYKDVLLPSFALRLVAHSKRVRPTRLELIADRGINIASHVIRTDDRFRVYPTYYTQSLPSFGIKALLDGKVKRADLRDKIVLLETGISGIEVTLPNGMRVSPADAQAQLVSAMLNQDFYVLPYAGRLMKWGGLIIIALYFWLLLPRLKIRTGFWLTLGILVSAISAEWLLLILQKSWLPLAVPVTMLLVGYLVLSGRQLRGYWSLMVRAQTGANEAYRRLGQLQQQQGQLDEAFSSLRRCQSNEAVLDNLYDLGMAYERKRQFNKAHAVLAYIHEQDRKYRDVRERIKRMQELESAAARGVTQGNAAATMVLSAGTMENPQLGRYQVDSMLGQGAMGTVYLANDPKIGRQVAIKTIALNAEFEPGEIEEAKVRFYREAEAAGRLNHPNIVTVYDVGEEEDLAYIAMDYLQGVNLSVYTKQEHLLPVESVLSIGSQVADALDYAHQHNVIHRDIKPGNIIFDPKTGKVSVTDFGIASMTDSSKTRTGTVLGTPSYMSPEQIAGKKVDGRSDEFSLAVTLYQMLCGQLPFEGDSLAALMFKITNEKHSSIRRIRSDLPPCISTILNRALQKEPGKRYETAAELARELRKCRDKA
ncbi:MAG: protein kinase [Gammaproteobacteria bacterium]|nr:protein kinase [Gammaproteobacteria bacterium]